MLQTREQEGAEPALLRPHAAQEVFAQKVSEKALGQVLRVLRAAALSPHERVEGIPIGAAQLLQGFRRLRHRRFGLPPARRSNASWRKWPRWSSFGLLQDRTLICTMLPGRLESSKSLKRESSAGFRPAVQKDNRWGVKTIVWLLKVEQLRFAPFWATARAATTSTKTLSDAPRVLNVSGGLKAKRFAATTERLVRRTLRASPRSPPRPRIGRLMFPGWYWIQVTPHKFGAGRRRPPWNPSGPKSPSTRRSIRIGWTPLPINPCRTQRRS